MNKTSRFHSSVRVFYDNVRKTSSVRCQNTHALKNEVYLLHKVASNVAATIFILQFSQTARIHDSYDNFIFMIISIN